MFALSPMVLRATLDKAGATSTLTVGYDDDWDGDIEVDLTADNNKQIVFDVSPIVRSLMLKRMQHIMDGDKAPAYYYSPPLYMVLGNGDDMYFHALFAAIPGTVYDEQRFDFYQGGGVLLPSGKAIYWAGLPFGVDAFSSAPKNYTFRVTPPAQSSINQWTAAQGIDNLIKRGLTDIAGEYNMIIAGTSYPLTVKTPCLDDLKAGRAIYIRFLNVWGGLSYALLQVTQDDYKSKQTYVQKMFALEAGYDFAVAPDRLVTGIETEHTFKAGTDQITRAQLDELRGILTSPFVHRYDVEHEVWTALYPKDTKVTETDAPLQEITIEFETNTEGF